jgi:L-2-hydroxycarboxylate dehydrogenase (NAD+)
MSNGGGRTAPTFGLDGVLGTNPLSVAIPGDGVAGGFCLDMATSMVAAGKLETAVREGREVPAGWVHSALEPPRLDERGKLEEDYPLLPLGGEGEETGGHKGYGLGLMTEIFGGALAGTSLQARLRETPDSPAAVGHFFGALKVSGFRDPREVSRDMEATFDVLRASRKAPGHDRIFIHGEPEAIAETENARRGVAVDPVVLTQLRSWKERLGLATDWPVAIETATP